MPTKTRRPLDARAFLESAGLVKRVVAYRRRQVVFSQGDPCEHVMYVQSGAIQLSVLSNTGKQAIVAVLGPGEFLGEGALAGHPIRLETATASVAHLFNSSEKRLARTLLLLARYGKENQPQRLLPKISQETLAEMVGTTRSRVNFFMNKFKKLGFIEYDGGLKINPSLLTVVVHE